MDKLFVAMAAAILVGAPLTAQAQDLAGAGTPGLSAPARPGYYNPARRYDRGDRDALRDWDEREGWSGRDGWSYSGRWSDRDAWGDGDADSGHDGSGFGVGDPGDDPSDGAPFPANVGRRPGAPPADCGRWIWRERGGAYAWVARPCPRPDGAVWQDRPPEPRG